MIFTEFEAVEWGLQVTKNAYVSSITMETDSQGVSDLVNNRKGSGIKVYWMVSKIQDQMNDFDNFRVQCVLLGFVTLLLTLNYVSF